MNPVWNDGAVPKSEPNTASQLAGRGEPITGQPLATQWHTRMVTVQGQVNTCLNGFGSGFKSGCRKGCIPGPENKRGCHAVSMLYCAGIGVTVGSMVAGGVAAFGVGVCANLYSLAGTVFIAPSLGVPILYYTAAAGGHLTYAVGRGLCAGVSEGVKRAEEFQSNGQQAVSREIIEPTDYCRMRGVELPPQARQAWVSTLVRDPESLIIGE